MKKCTLLVVLTWAFWLANVQPAAFLFPGDTNNDGVCNHYDILPIGLNFGRFQLPRPQPSLRWMPQPFQFWQRFLPVSEVNTGFSDANGDGFVNELDLDAFPVNYDSVQFGSLPPPSSWLDKLVDTLHTTARPIIAIRFDRRETHPKDTITAFLVHQIPPGHPTQALGMAAWLSYDQALVRQAGIEVEPLSDRKLMYVAATPETVSTWRSLPPGNLQFGAAAPGFNGLFGTDTIAAFHIIIEDVVLARQVYFGFDCEEFLLLNADERVLPVTFSKDSILIKPSPSPTTALTLERRVHIQPNPAQGFFEVRIDAPGADRVELHNHAGQAVWYSDLVSGEIARVACSHLAAGVYFLKVASAGQVAWRKVLVLR
jgi:hypothetical protein